MGSNVAGSKTSIELAIGVSGKLECAQYSLLFHTSPLFRCFSCPLSSFQVLSFCPVTLSYCSIVTLSMAKRKLSLTATACRAAGASKDLMLSSCWADIGPANRKHKAIREILSMFSILTRCIQPQKYHLFR